jgi:hypothetical protein
VLESALDTMFTLAEIAQTKRSRGETMLVTAISHEALAASLAPTISTNLRTELPDSLSYRPHYGCDADRVLDADVILQLKVNLARLEDLHGRVRFLMGEIGYLLKASDRGGF